MSGSVFASLASGAKFSRKNNNDTVLHALSKHNTSKTKSKSINFADVDLLGSFSTPSSKSATKQQPKKEHKPVDSETPKPSATITNNNNNDDGNAAGGAKKRTRRSRKKKKQGNATVTLEEGDVEQQALFKQTKSPVKPQPKPQDRLVEKDKKERQAHAEQISQFRRTMKIHVSGNGEIADPAATFDQIELPSHVKDGSTRKLLLANIEKSKYTEPTPIQMQSVPVMLSGRDIIACAPTGSGKTAAFLIPMILRLHVPVKGGIRSLIVAPTRELATQILREFTRLTAGKKFKSHILRKSTEASLANLQAESHAGDLVVATPLRLVHMLETKQIKLDDVESLVFDEADKLFELGFLEQVDSIIHAVNSNGKKNLTRSFFSATMPPQIESLAQSVMKDPVRVTIGTANAASANVHQELMFVGQEEGKITAFRSLLQQGKLKPPVMVFVQSKERAKDLYSELMYDGIRVDAIHAERTQNQRDTLIKKFREGDVWFLIATDLMARGIDFKGVNCVINYDFPTSAISYVHRIGRTGRAGRKGNAVTFFTEADMEYLRTIANVMKISGCEVPEWMQNLKKQSSRKKRDLEKKPPKRKHISSKPAYDRQREAKRRNMIKLSKKQHHGTAKKKN